MSKYLNSRFKANTVLFLVTSLISSFLVAMTENGHVRLKPSSLMKVHSAITVNPYVRTYVDPMLYDDIERTNYSRVTAELLKEQANKCHLYNALIEDETYAFAFRDKDLNLFFHDIENFVYWLMKNSRIKIENGQEEIVWMNPYIDDEELNYAQTLRVLIYYHTRNLPKPSHDELAKLFDEFLENDNLPTVAYLKNTEDISQSVKKKLLLERYANSEFLDKYFAGTVGGYTADRKAFIEKAEGFLASEGEKSWLIRPSSLEPMRVHEDKLDPDFKIFKTISYKKASSETAYTSKDRKDLEKDPKKLDLQNFRMMALRGLGFCVSADSRTYDHSWLKDRCFASIPRLLYSLDHRWNIILLSEIRQGKPSDYVRASPNNVAN